MHEATDPWAPQSGSRVMGDAAQLTLSRTAAWMVVALMCVFPLQVIVIPHPHAQRLSPR